MRRVFVQFDKDGNGKIDEAEMSAALAEMGKHFSDKQLRKIMEQADKDGSGGLDYEEFIEHISGKRQGAGRNRQVI
jgi:Ca2+-binding EF-hand superfamily protein